MSQDWPTLQFARVCEPTPFGRKRPKMHQSRRIFGLTPGGYYRGFADRVFANGSFADREFANWPRLYNGLRTRKVCSNGCSHQGQRCSPNNHEFQHRSLPLPKLPQVDSQLTRTIVTRQLAEPRPAMARPSFLTDVAEIARNFDDWVPASLSRYRSSRDALQTCFRRSTGKSGRSAPCRRDSCRRRFPTSFALPWRRGRKTRSQNRSSPRHRQPS
jgi:hypothetical protein